MKLLRTWISPLLAFGFATIANAAPVQYQITATHAAELIWNGTQSVQTFSNYLFADGTTISATFFYDSTTVATSSNNVGVYDLSNYGLNSYYTGSITNFSGVVSGHTFSSATGDTVVADSSANSYGGDGIFHQAGLAANPASPAYTSLQGFSIGDFTLVNIGTYVVGPNSFLSDQSLPTTLGNTSGGNTGFNLIFRDSAGNYRTAAFWGGNIAPVPLPSSVLFFISGLASLGASAYRKLKR